MAVRELRKHLRVQSESSAVLILEDGSRIKCGVRDVSLGGAYLVQLAQYGEPVALDAEQKVRIWIFHPGRAHEGPTVDAIVVRAEPGGPGVALRFDLQENADELVEHVAFEAERQRIPRGQLGMPILPAPKRNVFRRIREIGGPVGTVITCIAVFGVVKVVRALLDTLL